jgi:glutathione S-transferase
VHNILNPRSREYFRRTREADEGKALEELSPTEKRAEQFTSLQKGYNRLARCYEKNGTDGKGKFLMGDQISYGDFIIASWLMWTKPTVTVDEWERVMAYSDGRWKRLLQDLAEYQNVDEGEVYQTKA